MAERVGLGILTYNRPEAFRVCVESVIEHLSDVVDDFFVYNDGTDVYWRPAYKEVEKTLPKHWKVRSPTQNRGVATGKNWLLKQMMAAKDEYLFLCEDDNEILDSRAVTAYIEAHKTTGIHHLNFAYQGELNLNGPETFWEGLPIFPHCVGSYSFYTRDAIKLVGYMDEKFENLLEHVEHTNRIVRAGWTTPFWCFADVPDSEKYIRAQEIGSSLPPQDSDHFRRLREAVWHWRQKGTLPQGIGGPL